ncbi:hypothetical protein HDU77_003471 [Chytriomyces hyalinus]|nr:hypothetical protein HDU77_003471 [Chytriomyces hyalinus]
MSTVAQISTLHELRNGLVALRLDVVGKLDQAMMIIESLLAGSNCNVHPGKLDIAVAPAGGENLNDKFESVPNLAKLGQLDSEMTLLDDTSADSGEDEESTATDPPIAKFSYAHCTDLEVMACEVAVAASLRLCATRPEEMLEASVGSDSTVPPASGDCCRTPHFLHSSCMDPEVIEAEVAWVLRGSPLSPFLKSTLKLSRQDCSAQISTLHELRNGLVALRLDVVGKLDQAMMIIESLLAGSNCNVDSSKLDIAVAPAGGENLNDKFESVPNLAKLGQLDSEMTLLDDTSADSGEDEESTATEPAIAKFSYAHYTDLEAIASEVAFAASVRLPEEMPEASVGSDSTVPPASGDCCRTPHFLHSSCMDPEVIEAEVAWVSTRFAAFTVSEKHFEAVETRLVRCAAPPQQRTELKGTSVSSGSQCKSRRKRVYRPPAKGLSARLTQEQINSISLQRLKK